MKINILFFNYKLIMKKLLSMSKSFINYRKYTKSVWFMLRWIYVWFFVIIWKIFKSEKCNNIASNACQKEYIFNTPFWKYIWASLYGYSQMNEKYEIEIKEIVDKISKNIKNEDKYLINIWCNIGRWAIYLSYIYGYKVIAFEPAPETYYRLYTNIAFSQLYNLFETYNIGLWNKNWIMKFQYSNKDNWTAHFINDQDYLNKENFIDVPVRRFDDLQIENKKLNDTRLIIIDVEWFELEVLKWMKNSLSSFKNVNIIVEIWENQKNKEETIEYMKDLWYSCKKIDIENYLFYKK